MTGATTPTNIGLWARVYLATLVTFAVVDALWLGTLGGAMFKAALGSSLRSEPLLVAAGAFYLLYAAGLTALAVRPTEAATSPGSAAARGALLGLTAYGTFDLTCLAVLQGYTVTLALADMAWGTFVSAVSALAGGWTAVRWRSVS
jgi:uncharacterized membrane protein